MTPEQNRDRILHAISKIQNQPYKAPEAIRSQLYSFMIDEFERARADAIEKIAVFVERSGYATTAQLIRDGAWVK